MSATTTPLTRSERLDRLPVSGAHRKLLIGSGIGWALDALDVGLVAFVLAALAQQWQLTNSELSLIATLGFVGMAVGAGLGGLLADRIGRRAVFAVTLLLYGLATGASALATGVAVLLVLRFLTGLGLGAELPVASTLVSEYAPARIRGRIVVILEAFWAFGWLGAALVGYLVVPASPDGWRWAFAVGALPAVYALVVRYKLPESVRFLERKGRMEEAERAVRSFETSANVQPVVSPEPVLVREEQPNPVQLWNPVFRRRTAALWLTWFGVNFSYYGAFIWMPTILVASGFTLVRSFEYTLIITLAQLPGYAVAAVLIETWGRRATLVAFLAGSAVSALAFGFSSSATTILITGMALSFFNLGAWGALYAVTPEIYPTLLRGTGAGSAAAFGRLASILAPLVVLPLRDAVGLVGLFFVFTAAFAMAMVAAVFLPEWRGRELA
jgi:MFS transporter, putative metabolite:H+ symporter